MKHSIINTFLLSVGAILLQTAAAEETTTLVKMLAMVKKDADANVAMRPLFRDWIGDIKDGVGSDAPVYIKSVPINKRLRSCSTVAELQELLGTGQPSFSGWSDSKGMHSSHSWVCFSPSGDDRLTYINVFVHTSFNEKQRAKGITKVNELIIQRGELLPANPDNLKERGIYLSGADKFAADEADKARQRQRYPQPLRSLILIDEHPDDPDLKHMSVAIQAIRKAPDPKLFAQLVQEMHEGTLKIRSLLNHILLNEHDLLELKKWGAREKAIAVGACIDSLPLAKDSAQDDLIETILRVCGGGKIEIEGANGGRSIEVIPTKSGYQMTFGGASDPLPLAQAQTELRRLYTNSEAEQDGTDQSDTAPELKLEEKEKPKPKLEGRSQ